MQVPRDLQIMEVSDFDAAWVREQVTKAQVTKALIRSEQQQKNSKPDWRRKLSECKQKQRGKCLIPCTPPPPPHPVSSKTACSPAIIENLELILLTHFGIWITPECNFLN